MYKDLQVNKDLPIASIDSYTQLSRLAIAKLTSNRSKTTVDSISALTPIQRALAMIHIYNI